MIQQTRGLLIEDVARRHRDALQTSTRLTSYFREKHQPMAVDITPEHVIDVLHEAGIRCVLMGTHALNTYRDEARATQDVDVLVRKKDVARAIRVLSQAFDALTVKDAALVTRFVDPATDKPVIDLMKPTQKVYQMVFRQTVPVGDTHEIPNLEMALVSKFAAMVSPYRKPGRKLLDGADFYNIAETNMHTVDLAKLRNLAAKVYPGAAKEIMQLIKNIQEGREITY